MVLVVFPNGFYWHIHDPYYGFNLLFGSSIRKLDSVLLACVGCSGTPGFERDYNTNRAYYSVYHGAFLRKEGALGSFAGFKEVQRRLRQ